MKNLTINTLEFTKNLISFYLNIYSFVTGSIKTRVKYAPMIKLAVVLGLMMAMYQVSVATSDYINSLVKIDNSLSLILSILIVVVSGYIFRDLIKSFVTASILSVLTGWLVKYIGTTSFNLPEIMTPSNASGVVFILVALKGILLFINKLINKRGTSSERTVRIEELEKIAQNNPSKAGYAFETYLKQQFISRGMNACTARDLMANNDYPKEIINGDGGADVIVELDENTIGVVQAKYYKGKINNDPVNKLRGIIGFFQNHYSNKNVVGIIITNSEFTSAALSQASSDIRLIDGVALNSWIQGSDLNSIN
jgi:HJR/Mrr/RecB family endonuclease